MAVSISNTKHYKKGEKLPDGTTAKRGVVWNTKTGKRVTGTVTMTSAAGVAAKKYKGGRSVTSIKRAADKKAASSSSRPKSKIDKPDIPADPNANVKVGTVRKGAAGKQMNRWNGKRWVPVSGTTASARSSETTRARNVAATSGKSGSYKPRPITSVPAKNTGGAKAKPPAYLSGAKATSRTSTPFGASPTISTALSGNQVMIPGYGVVTLPKGKSKSWLEEYLAKKKKDFG